MRISSSFSRPLLVVFMICHFGLVMAAEKSAEDQARFHFKIALAALKQNDYLTAAKELEEAVKLAPQNALIHYNLAVVYGKQLRIEDAKNALNKAIELGLSGKDKDDAETLLAELTYKGRDHEFINFFIGQWECKHISYDKDTLEPERDYQSTCTVSSSEPHFIVRECNYDFGKESDSLKFDTSNRSVTYAFEKALPTEKGSIIPVRQTLTITGQYDPAAKTYTLPTKFFTYTVKVINPNEYRWESISEKTKVKSSEFTCVRQTTE